MNLREGIMAITVRAAADKLTAQEISCLIVLYLEFDIDFSLWGNGWLDNDEVMLKIMESEETYSKLVELYRKYLEN